MNKFITTLLFLGVLPNLSANELLLHWTFDNPYEFGAFEHDASGNNHDGVVVWDRIGSWGGMRWAPDRGIIGGAANMPNGVRGYIKSVNEISLPEEWTLSFWVHPVVTKGRIDSLLCLRHKNEDKQRVLNIGGNRKGGYDILHQNGEQKGNYSFVYPMMEKDQWSHVTVVWRKGEITCSYQGESQNLPLKTTWDPSLALELVFSGGSHQHRSYGLFDELRIYNRALSPEEVKKLSDVTFYASEKRAPVADGGMGYTAWLKKGGRIRGDKATINMAGGELRPGQNAGKTSYRWTVLSQPKGAKGKFTDSTNPKTVFSTHKAGSYRFKLEASNDAGTDTALVNGAVFTPDSGPGNPKLYTVPADLFEGQFIPPHPERAAPLKGQSIAPIAYWSFDENSATGIGPKAKTLELPEAASFEAAGQIGGALAVRPEKKKDGVIDFGEIPELAEEFTLAFWVTSERDNLKTAFFKAMGQNNQTLWSMDNSHNSSKTPQHSSLRFKDIGGVIRIEGQWRHIAISYSRTGDFRKLWVNGWLVESKAHSPNSQESTGIPRLIFSNPGDDYSFEGIIDEVVVYDKMLNNEELYQLYEHGVSSLTERVEEDPYSTLAYRKSFREKWFPEPLPHYQSEGFAEERFNGGDLPAYTHPRLNMTLEDLPRIRQSLLNSRHGHNNRSFMQLFTRTIFGDDLANYSPNSVVIDGEAKHNNGSEAVARIALAYEALLTADHELARMLIDHMMKSADIQQEAFDAFLAKGNNSWQGSQDILGRRMTPILYDTLYNFMTVEERAKIRTLLATATQRIYGQGMYAMPAGQCHSSNWQPWITGDLVITMQSIYGEEGFNPQGYREASRAVQLCAEIMNDPESGVHREGMGKSNIASTQMSVIAMAQPTGKKIISSKALYNNVAKFHLHAGLPWDPGKVMYDQKNGGSAALPVAAINVLHYAYPQDPILNFMKHCIDAGPEKYVSQRPRTFGQESWAISAVYTQDWEGPEDLHAHLKQAVEAAGEPLGYFADARGQMISRSSWEKDALQLNYVARAVVAGHKAPIRGYFRVNALGTEWLDFRSRANSHSRVNSLVTVDGQGQDASSVRTLYYRGASHTKGATFDLMGSDLTAAYRHADNPFPNLNYTRLKPDPRPWFDMPFKYLVHWYYGDRPQKQILDFGEVEFDPENYKGKQEFAYAYRTAAFARGEHPYILIVDDVKKDDQTREYIWHAALNAALKKNLGDHQVTGDTAILTDAHDPTKHLYVRMFGYEGNGTFVIEHVLPTQDVDRPKMDLKTDLMPHNLKFKSRSNTAKFRALIYAFRDGDPMPTIAGKAGAYTITIGEQIDTLDLSTAPEHGVKVQLTRK